MLDAQEDSRRKSFAVAVLSEVWAGVKLPQQLTDHALEIRAEMMVAGTWEGA